jgi:uncharacterized protein DUF4167
MRNGQNNNNKRMRNRNNNNNHSSNNNNRRSQNPMTRVFDSNGPDIKIRGTAAHVAEKYLQLARDSQSSGDPVAAENYYQHAEHYFRLIAAAQEQFRQSQPQQQPRLDQDMRDDNGDDGEENFSNFGAEPGFVAREPQPSYQPRESQPYQPREHQREQSPRDQGFRDQGPRDQGFRDQGPRDQGQRDQGQRDQGQRDQAQRDQAPRDQGPRDQPREQNFRDNRPQPQPTLPIGDGGDVDRLPSFITGAQPQPVNAANGFEGNGHQAGERFPPRRRRRPQGPRPEGARPEGAARPEGRGPQGEDFPSGD